MTAKYFLEKFEKFGGIAFVSKFEFSYDTPNGPFTSTMCAVRYNQGNFLDYFGYYELRSLLITAKDFSAEYADSIRQILSADLSFNSKDVKCKKL